MIVSKRILAATAGATLIVGCSMWTLLAAGRAQERPRLTDAEAKAGFLYNCALFVEWSRSTLAADVLVIGIFGDEAVSKLAKDMQGQSVNGRTIIVQAVPALDQLPSVHVLFVAGSDPDKARAVLARVRSAPVLTVGEHDSFTSDGGIVRLFTDDGRLRFEIDMTHAENAGLRVSAKMLGLAKIVR